jgi:hypothetical protein
MPDIGRKLLERLRGGAPAQLLAVAEQVAQDARRDWYGPQGVRRVTGRTGDIQAEAIISESEVRVRVFSTDTRKDKRGRPAVAFVRRPGSLSLVPIEIDKAAYTVGKASPKPELFFHARKADPPSVQAGKFYKLVPNPQAGDGKYLFQVLVRAPFKSRINKAVNKIRKDVIHG